MMQWHPDRVDHNPALKEIATEKSKEINSAAEFLLSLSEPSAQAPSATREQSKAAPSSGSESSTSQEQAKEQARQKQAAQDAETKRKKREDEEARRREEAQAAQREAKRQAQAAEREAERQAQAAQREAERQAQAIAYVERAEQLRQQKINATKTKRKRVLIAAGILAVFAWQHISSNQASSDQQETPATSSQPSVSVKNDQEAVPETAPNNTAQNTNLVWQDASKEMTKSDNGRHLIGMDRDHLHNILGQPTLTFNRQASVNEEMWFAPHINGFVSVVFEADRVIQVENAIPNSIDAIPDAKYLLLGEVKKKHPVLHVSAYSYDLDVETLDKLTDAEGLNYSATKHFQGNAITYYYDDVLGGIAFSLQCQDFFDEKADIQTIIVHVPGAKVLPAINGKSTPAVDEVRDASKSLDNPQHVKYAP